MAMLNYLLGNMFLTSISGIWTKLYDIQLEESLAMQCWQFWEDGILSANSNNTHNGLNYSFYPLVTMSH